VSDRTTKVCGLAKREFMFGVRVGWCWLEPCRMTHGRLSSKGPFGPQPFAVLYASI
jgi:hypothetical protein